MSNNKGIFEPQECFAAPPKSLFSVDDAPSNPFSSAPAEPKSPFAVASEEPPTRLTPQSEPFASAPAKSPFASEAEQRPSSPFSQVSAEEKPAPAPSPFSQVAPEEARPAVSPFSQAAPEEPKPAPSPFAQVQPEAPKPAPEPVAKQAAPAPALSGESDSSSIRQLELRAIFGVDRELTENEILQRARALPGIRQVARIPAADVGAIESVKRLMSTIGFGDGQVKLYCGSSPIEFVREGSVLLAVQNDGGFAPGVRETLMIVARELGRM